MIFLQRKKKDDLIAEATEIVKAGLALTEDSPEARAKVLDDLKKLPNTLSGVTTYLGIERQFKATEDLEKQ